MSGSTLYDILRGTNNWEWREYITFNQCTWESYAAEPAPAKCCYFFLDGEMSI